MKNRHFRVIYLTLLLVYVVFLFVMNSLNYHGYDSPMYVGLESASAHLREGGDIADLLHMEPDAALPGEGWIDITGKSWRVMDTPFGQQHEKPFLTLQDDAPQYYTYAIQFPFTQAQMDYMHDQGTVPGLFFSSIADNWEIYLNGHLIADQMDTGDQGQILHHHNTQMYKTSFAPANLRIGTNMLVIRVLSVPWYGDTGLYYRSGYYINDYEQILLEHNEMMLMLVIGIYIFSALFNMLLFLGGTSERHHLHFAMEAMLLAIYTIMNTSMAMIYFVDSIIYQTLEFLSLGLLPLPMILFVHRITQQKIYWPLRVSMGLVLAFSIIMPLVGLQARLDILAILEASLVLHVFYVIGFSLHHIIVLTKEYQAKSNTYWIIALLDVLVDSLIGSIFISTVIVSVAAFSGLYNALVLRSEPSSMLYILSAYVIGVTFALAHEVNRTKEQIAEHNRFLETRVAERTSELREQRNMAITANAAKSRFLATMSHEIRTPINAILGASEIELERPSLAMETAHALRIIYSSGHNLLGIINDLLDLTKIESSSMEITNTPYDLPDLIAETVQMNIMRIGDKNITIHLDIDEDLPKTVVGDGLHVKQIFNNILTNAVKYTERGRIVIRIWGLPPQEQGEGEDNGKMLLAMRVQDTGVGMTQGQLAQIFDPYTRFRENSTRTIEGTGLGMNITHNLVKIMGGTIEVQSEYGQGSVFEVKLPQERRGEEKVGKALSDKLGRLDLTMEETGEQETLVLQPMPGAKVLVVDDVPANLFVAKGLLELYQMQPDTAGSGFEAVQKVRAGQQYDIIFMDHMMPELDGVEAMRKLHSIGYTQPIVVLTANALVGEAEKFLEAGFDGFISKPINRRHLDDVLKQFIPPSAYGPGVAQALNTSAGEVVQLPGVNGEVGLAYCGGSASAYRELLGIFASSAAESLQKLESLSQAEDLKLFTILVHGYKSSLASIGAVSLSGIAAALETAGQAGDRGKIRGKLSSFSQSMTGLLQAIDAVLGHPQDEAQTGEALPEADLTALLVAMDQDDWVRANALVEDMTGRALDGAARTLASRLAECVLMADGEAAAVEINRYLGKEANP